MVRSADFIIAYLLSLGIPVMDCHRHILLHKLIDRRHGPCGAVDASVGSVPAPDIAAKRVAPGSVVQADSRVCQADPVIHVCFISPLAVVLLVAAERGVPLLVVGKESACRVSKTTSPSL